MDKVDVEEKKRMFELMKDRELGGNMDWMYRGGKPDTEEFLLGKSVDKMVSEATTTTTEEGSVSIFSERIKANVALDMQAKMREDPLFAIKKKEEDARRRLLENPVKMKQLEKLVEQQRQQKSKATKKAKKEKKSKKKKKKRSRSSDDSDSSDSEDDLVNKYLTILTQKKKSGDAADASSQHKHSRDKPKFKNGGGDQHSYEVRHRNRNDDSYRHRDDRHQKYSGQQQRDRDRDYEHSESKKMHDRNSRRRSKSPARQRRKGGSSSDESEHETHKVLCRQDSSEEEVSKKVYGLIKTVRHSMGSADPPPPPVKVKTEDTKRARSSSSSSSSRSRSPKRLAHRKEQKRRHSPTQQHGSDKKRSGDSRSRSPVRKRTVTSSKRHMSKSDSPPRKRRSQSPPRKKLTAEERERKLREMMDNAKWRDEQRITNVQRYKHEEDKEKESLSTYKGDPNFLSSMMSDHASSSSVEDRLKRNKYNIQRTRAALDKNFTQH